MSRHGGSPGSAASLPRSPAPEPVTRVLTTADARGGPFVPRTPTVPGPQWTGGRRLGTVESPSRVPPRARAGWGGRGPPSAVDQLEDRRVRHPAALAHGLQPVARAGVHHGVDERGHDAGARGTQRVTERDGATAGVQPPGRRP